MVGPRVAFVGFTKCKRQGEKRLNTAEMGGDGQRAGKGPSREPPVSSHVSIRSSTRKLDTYKAMSPCMAKHLLKLDASPIREEIKLAGKLNAAGTV